MCFDRVNAESCVALFDAPFGEIGPGPSRTSNARAKLHDGACAGMFRVIARDKGAAALLDDGENPVGELVRKATSPVIGFKDVPAKEADPEA